MEERADVVIIGAGAAGLTAAIWAGRTYPGQKIQLLDSARKLGAKILVSGGGRCNVTHYQVTAADYAGSTRPAIAKLLRRFDVAQTIAFFRELGVDLKQEETGKLFPTTDKARTVLDALLNAAVQAGVSINHPCRVTHLSHDGCFYQVEGDWGRISAGRVIIATGGKSLPKSGSDGTGYGLVAGLGHTITPRLLPALVALTLPSDHYLCQLSGVAQPAVLRLSSGSGKLLKEFTGNVLCTHFGLSGPAVLDISRYYLDAILDDPQARLAVNWLPQMTPEAFDQALLGLGSTSALAYLRRHLPDRMAKALVTAAGAEQVSLTRAQRLSLVAHVTRHHLPITGHRGFNYAEATAGGVPLNELNLKTMESRKSPGLFLCGEICDVDGRIGGFNFQWAWSSGYVAGISVGQPG